MLKGPMLVGPMLVGPTTFRHSKIGVMCMPAAFPQKECTPPQSSKEGTKAQ